MTIQKVTDIEQMGIILLMNSLKLSQNDIALKLNISQPTVARQLKRALSLSSELQVQARLHALNFLIARLELMEVNPANFSLPKQDNPELATMLRVSPSAEYSPAGWVQILAEAIHRLAFKQFEESRNTQAAIDRLDARLAVLESTHTKA